MESLQEQLDNLEELIAKAYSNFKKCPKVRLTSGYLQARIRCLEEYWTSFRNCHLSLIKITSKQQRVDVRYFTEDRHSICEDIYMEYLAEMTDKLNFINNNTELRDIPSEQSLTFQQKNMSMDVKLPRINLPTYSGAYEEWQSFEDTFISLIESNPHITDVQKLHYLKSCVTGEAKNTIKHFQITEKNYKPAWDSLKNRYSHRRLIVNAILKRLLSLRKINHQSPSQLKGLIDNTKECLNSLNAMEINTDSWDPVIIFLTVQKLDSDSHNAWETHVSSEYFELMPTFKNFITFLESRICTLELISPTSTTQRLKERTYLVFDDDITAAAASTSSVQTHPTCRVCKEEHFLCHCKEFGKWTPEKRSEYVKDKRLCFNCLAFGHSVHHCRQKSSCKVCGRRHHSLLHSSPKRDFTTNEEDSREKITSLQTRVDNENQEMEDVKIASYFVSRNQRALLATAMIPVQGNSGEITVLRALIDPGSQASFVSERATQMLKLHKTQITGTVTGVGSTKTTVSHVVRLTVLSRYEKNFMLPVKAYVLSTQLTSQLPNKAIKPMKWSHLDGLNLADPSYFTPGNIDMLLGIDVYTEILKNNLIKGPPGSPSAQETTLGWILFGSINDTHSDESTIVMHHQVDINMDNMLRQMWEIDHSTVRNLTPNEKRCEDIFKENYRRAHDGRYIVKLPFKSENPLQEIGDTKNIAQRRYYQLENRFNNNLEMKEEYSKVMEEYIQLNHAEKVPTEERDNPASYLPHHAVVRYDKETTKLRIVFNASCKGSNNKSLNDEMLVGPTLQEDLRDIIMRWRMKPVCFVADIQKMYRQILVHKSDADYQRIFWRDNNTHELEEYRLLRVTFGTASAPYLAVKTLIQLAIDEENTHPRASEIIKQDFYVDDCMSGCNTEEEAIEMYKELTETLKKGGFILQKWASNSITLMNEIDPSLRCANATKEVINERVINTLGLTWNIASDLLQYHFNLPSAPETITKRNILADIHRIFDPLGWLAGATIPAKIIIQQLWMKQSQWDDEVDSEVKKEWLHIRENFEHLKQIEIPRWLNIDENTTNVTLHGFCDASCKAYCAVVYCRSEMKNRKITTQIVASKTRVAPVKPVSLPRLELQGAVLLSKLLTQVREAMRIPASKVYAWTDSSVVLAWLFGDPARWKPFVSNRVVEILDNICGTQWFHVISSQNPADIGSRGQSLKDLIENDLWWNGPKWLLKQDIDFTRPKNITTDLEKKKQIQVNTKIDVEDDTNINFTICVTLEELLKVVVYSCRFINCKKNPAKIESSITTTELEEALNKCIRIVQLKEFSEDIERLEGGNNVKNKSKLKSLCPYLDVNKILRVGGRLNNADMDENLKHPIILGTKNDLTHLIIANAHRMTMHGGIQQMLCYIRSKYWIIRAKDNVKAYIHKCIICARHKAVIRTQMMGNLPKVRVSEARPFLHSGVDFAGPLTVLMSKGRGAKSNKAYIAIFICMATKAIHLELVGDMTAEAFIGAFNRFIARRGRCTHIWSDQGKNFIGASKELVAAWKEANLELPGPLSDKLSEDGTQWHFIPPYSPNFGGLWEAGVKSVKYHLKRVLTNSVSFEEMTTILCQIEACLNSRPLIPIDNSDTEAEPLTPGHFLIGEAPVNIPSPDLRNINAHTLSRWQLTQKLVRDFWHRWQTEYLSRLQQRPKWLKHVPEYEIGDIVIIKDEQLPPGKWSLGRIVEKHPGQDHITRVYSIKSHNKIVKRCISKLCKLPIDTVSE